MHPTYILQIVWNGTQQLSNPKDCLQHGRRNVLHFFQHFLYFLQQQIYLYKKEPYNIYTGI